MKADMLPYSYVSKQCNDFIMRYVIRCFQRSNVQQFNHPNIRNEISLKMQYRIKDAQNDVLNNIHLSKCR